MRWIRTVKINAFIVHPRTINALFCVEIEMCVFFPLEPCRAPISGRVTPVLYIRNANETENNAREMGKIYNDIG